MLKKAILHTYHFPFYYILLLCMSLGIFTCTIPTWWKYIMVSYCYVSFPSSTFSDFMLISSDQPWWEYLPLNSKYYKLRLISPKNQLLKRYQPTTLMGYSKILIKAGLKWVTLKYLKNYSLKNRWWHIGNIVLNGTKL